MKTKKIWSIMMMLVFAIGVAISISSCSKDDKEDSDVQIDKLSAIMLGHWRDDSKEYNDTYSIWNNKKFLYEHYHEEANRIVDVLAEGTYEFDGTVLTVNYNNIYADTSYDGFVEGKTCQKKYTIISCDGKKMVIKNQNGKLLNLIKYSEVND